MLETIACLIEASYVRTKLIALLPEARFMLDKTGFPAEHYKAFFRPEKQCSYTSV